jgi:hypothetical protein
MATHKRKSVRKRVTAVMMVTNAFTAESLGRIGNLSKEGLMLIAPKSLHEEHYLQLGFVLQHGSQLNRKVEIGVQVSWCDQARTANTYWVGCRIVDVSPDDAQQLARWVELAEEVVP